MDTNELIVLCFTVTSCMYVRVKTQMFFYTQISEIYTIVPHLDYI